MKGVKESCTSSVGSTGDEEKCLVGSGGRRAGIEILNLGVTDLAMAVRVSHGQSDEMR